ncbi:MAG: hypothetical protein ACR2PH_11260 [Desulfobulbia bacterium]
MTTSNKQHIRKIGINRGKRRIWLEGAELTDRSIRHGMRFNVHPGNNGMQIVINPDGKRKIAGTPARPIIDMSGGTVTAAFSDDVEHFIVLKTDSGIMLKGCAAPWE